MTNWKKYKLGDIAEIVGGGTPSTKVDFYWDGDIPWITPRDLSNFKDRFIVKGERNITKDGLSNSSSKLLPKGSVLLSSRAPVGYLAIAKKDLCTNQGFKSLIPKNEFNNIFLYYLLLNNVDLLKSNATGTTFGELSGGRLKQFEFHFPPLEEQKAIAEVLSSLDDKIELNRRQNETLENIAQALFKHWFVDFEFPDKNGEPYKSSGGQMHDSELGPIPKSWRVGKIRDLIDVRDGTHDSPKPKAIGKYLITSKHIKNYEIDFSTPYLISEEDFSEINRRSQVNKYDILFTMIGTIGNIYLVQNDEINFAIKNVGLFKTSQNLKLLEYVFLHLKSKYISEFITSISRGTTQQYVPLDGLRTLPIIIPSDSILNSFKSQTQLLIEKINININSNKTLSQLRDTLLPKLMSGKVQVKDL